MYSVEGKLTVLKNPEDFLGRHGIFHETVERHLGNDFREQSETDTVWFTGSQPKVSFVANRLRKKGRIPADLPVEKITSFEQAEKYARPTSKDVNLVKFKMPDFPEVLHAHVPEGSELLEGEARLWKELQIPIPYIYFLGRGSLLNEVEYSPDTGWQDRYDLITGSRLTLGVITPIITAAHSWTKTKNSPPRYSTNYS